MKKSKIPILLVLLASIFVVACSSNMEEEAKPILRVAAAISLQEALYEISEIYEKDRDVELTFQFGGSGTLARQIEHGAEVDVFLSANILWMDRLEDLKFIDQVTRNNIVSNQLVLVTSNESAPTYQNISEINPNVLDQISIGNPDSVPAGDYTKEALQAVGIWERLENRLVLAKDVRQVMTYVDSGNVPYGFIYRSDARTNNELHIVAPVDDNLHGAIIYPGAVIAESEQGEAATEFLNFLLTEEAQAVFEDYGFIRAG